MLSFVLDIRDKVLLFDFDGTLVESEFLAQEVIDEYFSKLNLGYPVPSHFVIGRTWEAAIQLIREDAKKQGFELEPVEVLHVKFKKHYLEKLKTGVKLIPGLKECLDTFKSEARAIALVTGSDHEEVQTILKAHQLSHYFDKIWAFGDYDKSKPDPSPYLAALKGLGAKPSEALVFEDSRAGMESAFRAGIPFVQVTHATDSKQPDPRAIKVIRDWHDFVAPM